MIDFGENKKKKEKYSQILFGEELEIKSIFDEVYKIGQ